MRKLFAMLLALTMVLSTSATAFAADTDTKKPTEDYRSEGGTADILIEKLYEVVGSKNTGLYPAETLTFTAVPDADNPDKSNLTIEPLTVTGNANQALTIQLPVYSKVGTYRYDISETTEKEMQGVTYSDDVIAVTVLVTYNYTEEKLDTQIVLSTSTAGDQSSDTNDDDKVDTFINRYDVGTLTLKKTVTGNLGAKDVYFDIEVTFTSPEEVASDITVSGGSHESNADVIAMSEWTETDSGYTCTKVFKLKDTDLLTFADIPAGVSYSVEEDEKHLGAGNTIDVNSAEDTGYKVTYGNASGAIVSNTTAEATVTNEKGTTVETGVLLDSMPYVLMLTAAAAGLIILTNRKRYEI